MITIEEFSHQILREVLEEANDGGVAPSDVFFERMTERLEAAGEIETADRGCFDGSASGKTLRIDGIGGDPREAEGVLSVIISDFRSREGASSMNAAESKRLFGHLINFLIFAKKREFRETLPVGSPGVGLAELISDSWNSIAKIKLILITNAVFSGRTDAVVAGKIGETPVTYNVWDLSRFHRFDTSGQGREDIVIEFRDEYGGSVPALAASRLANELESYLLVIPGPQLAEIYDKWGARLMESNVRSFLQARGKVNQGIRDTIKKSPEMFFSYNNGISATADAVEVERSSEGLQIVSARNLQIVNGGQTTASLHSARRSSPDNLANLHIQMKLTIVPAERSQDVVPKISEYANSQNKVSAADFFSNHPFHVRMEEYSRRILAPAHLGAKRETKWFYERARGQYLVERSKRSDAERRRFDTEFPKAQFFSKTDLAKVEFSFRCRPEIVSRGAQKNFAQFAKEIGDAWSRSNTQFDETWFRRLVGKLIVFRFLEKAVPKQKWYPGGYRANIVTYAIGKIVTDADKLDLLLDLDGVWKAQAVSEELAEALLSAAEGAAKVIAQPAAGIRNLTEWAKKQACWEQLKNLKIRYATTFETGMVEPQEAKETARESHRDEELISGIEAQTRVVSAGTSLWANLRSWCHASRKFTPKDDDILRACESLSGKLPTEKQCIAALVILEKAVSEGYQVAESTLRVKLTGFKRHH